MLRNKNYNNNSFQSGSWKKNNRKSQKEIGWKKSVKINEIENKEWDQPHESYLRKINTLKINQKEREQKLTLLRVKRKTLTLLRMKRKGRSYFLKRKRTLCCTEQSYCFIYTGI